MYESVAIYVRLSDEDRDKEGGIDSKSIQNQKSLLIDYAQKQGWNIYKIYSDDDYSGGDRNRPEWNRMLNDCKNGKIDIVLCKSQSRFSREIAVVEDVINGKFQEWGVRFVGVVDNADTDNPLNRKSRQINGLVNEWYLEDCSQNVRNILRHKAEKGEFVGSFAPYGYKKDPNDKHKLIIDPEPAKIVQRIFNEYVNMSGVTRIAKRLNEDGIMPPSVYKTQQSESKNFYNTILDLPENRKIWTTSTLTRMIDNEMYIGNMVQGRHHNLSYKCHKKVVNPKKDWIVVEGTHEPIIDKETWKLAQEKRKSRCREGNRIAVLSPLSRILVCKRCGAYMMRSVSNRNYGAGRYRYVSCSTRKTSTACDNYRYISYDVVEQHIINEINAVLKAYYDENQILIKEHTNIIEQQINDLKHSIAKNEKELLNKKNLLYSLYQDKVAGVISEQEFGEFRQTTLIDCDRLTNLNVSLNASLNSLLNKAKDNNNQKALLSKYQQISELTFDIVNEFIEKVALDMDDNKNITIEISWKI